MISPCPRLRIHGNGTGDHGRGIGGFLRWVCAAGLLTVLAAGCSGPTTEVLDRAVTATLDQADHRMTMTGTVFGTDRAVLGTMQADGHINLGTDGRELQVEITPDGTATYRVDVRALSGEVFQRGLPGFPDDTWLLVQDAPDAISADLPTFVDPRAVLDLLTGLEGSVTDLGAVEVDGVAARHVRVVLPPARISRSVQAVLAAAVPTTADRPAIDPITATAVAEAWIDDDNLVRQMTLETSVTVADGQAIPGIGATDNQLSIRLDPEESTTIIPPEQDSTARTDFAALFRTGR